MHVSNCLSQLSARAVAVVCLLGLIFTAACTTPQDPVHGLKPASPATELTVPQASPAAASAYPAEQVERGKYMVKLLGCGICHTDGALVGRPDHALGLAGSSVGIAYTDPLADRYPGVVYPPNITPHVETGIGGWSEGEIVRLLRSGEASHGRRLLAVMPWPTYAWIDDADAEAIAAYLLSLAPVKHRVPANVSPGQRASAPYVHFGVYLGRP